MEVLELQPLIWATTACSQSVCPREPYGRGSSGHIRGGMASNPHTMNTREHHGRRLSAKSSGRRWTLPAVPVGAGGRPHSVGIVVTSSFPWTGSGVLDGCEVDADRRKHRSALFFLLAPFFMPTDTRRCRERYNGAPMLISRSPGAQPTNQPLLESCNGRVTVTTSMAL